MKIHGLSLESCAVLEMASESVFFSSTEPPTHAGIRKLGMVHVRGLERRGWIVQDRKSYAFTITQEGKEAWERIKDEWIAEREKREASHRADYFAKYPQD